MESILGRFFNPTTASHTSYWNDSVVEPRAKKTDQ